MRPLSMEHDEASELFLAQLADFLDACQDLGDFDLLEASRCRGWSRLELVEHVRIGLDEMAATTAAFTAVIPDHDAASYWGSHPDDRDEDPIAHVMWLRRTASAYGRPTTAVRRLHASADSLERVIQQAPDRVVHCQGKAMRSGDFIATWIAELAIHQLDLATTAENPAGLPFAQRTIEAVAEADIPDELTHRDAVLVGLGRIPTPVGVHLPCRFPVTL